MQVYLCDGPKAGHVIEVPSFQPIQFIDCGQDSFRGSPKYPAEAFNYQIHTFGEQLMIDHAECWAFPDWKFVTWSLADLEWARFFCRKTAREVIERRWLEVGSIGQPPHDAGRKARSVIPLNTERFIQHGQPPKGFVWPVEYRRHTPL